MRGTNVQSAGVTNVVNIQDSQEQASGAIAGGEAVYTQRVNQSQKGRRAQGESSGRKRGTGQGGERRRRVSGVLTAPLPLLAQEDPRKTNLTHSKSEDGAFQVREATKKATRVRPLIEMLSVVRNREIYPDPEYRQVANELPRWSIDYPGGQLTAQKYDSKTLLPTNGLQMHLCKWTANGAGHTLYNT
eukprot:896881-Prorocentrum_minimum.AAC.3